MRHLLNITDLTAEELVQVLHLAERTDLRPVLAGLGRSIFEKPSNRTRQSMRWPSCSRWTPRVHVAKRSVSTPASLSKT